MYRSGSYTRRPARSCCGGGGRSIVQVNIDGIAFGIMGLREIFEQLYIMRRRPEPAVGSELLEMVRAMKNYIPRGKEAIFQAALLREYAMYYAREEVA